VSPLTLLLALPAGLSLLASIVLTRLAVALFPRLGFLDRPGGHKTHPQPVPYGGGIAVFLAAWVPFALALAAAPGEGSTWVVRLLGAEVVPYLGGIATRTGQALIILAGAVAICALGLLDDLRPLAALPKLAAIVGVSLLVAWAGKVRIGTMWGTIPSIGLTVLWFVALINAFNFLDNMDGLSAGVAWICLVFFAVCGLMAGQVLVPALACLFLGAIGGFWLFNFPPARIFMGDAGSLLVGYMLACVSVLTTYYESAGGAPAYALAMPLVILAVPLYDLASVVLIRLAEKRSPLQGDQRHFSHRLVGLGLSRRGAVVTIYLATATTGLAATLLPGADLRRTLTIAILVAMVLGIVAILEGPLRKSA
jgi:UDP-GlcNAc:undecaprenyl-phosphate GlcNAc-1-phosphate transferase